MKTINALILASIVFAFFACDDTQNTDGSISANRLIAVPETADENADPEEAVGVAAISFDETEYNFGEIESGEVVEHTFAFTNSGEAPLIITNAKASCGCTVPKWPKDPIEPGASGEIQVRFDSKGKSGVQNKNVTITANTQPSQTVVLIKGMVKSPKPAAEQPS